MARATIFGHEFDEQVCLWELTFTSYGRESGSESLVARESGSESLVARDTMCSMHHNRK